jgi:hypothetical protein
MLEAQEDRVDFPDAAWERYRQDDDAATLTDAYLGFFQATFQPSLLHSLEPFGSVAERKLLEDGLEAAIRRGITPAPQPLAQIPLHTIVLRRIQICSAKDGSHFRIGSSGDSPCRTYRDRCANLFE